MDRAGLAGLVNAEGHRSNSEVRERPPVYNRAHKRGFPLSLASIAMSDTTTIRVDRDVHAALKSIAEDEGQTLSDTLRTLVEAHRRDRLFDQSDRAYQRLRDDEDAWTEVEEERRDLEGTQADGLGENNA